MLSRVQTFHVLPLIMHMAEDKGFCFKASEFPALHAFIHLSSRNRREEGWGRGIRGQGEEGRRKGLGWKEEAIVWGRDLKVHEIFPKIKKVTFHSLATSCENMASNSERIMEKSRNFQIVYVGRTNLCKHCTTDHARGIMKLGISQRPHSTNRRGEQEGRERGGRVHSLLT